MEKHIIIDLRTKKALYAINQYTLQFDTEAEAINVAKQFFESDDHYLIIKIKIKLPIPVI